MTVQSLKLLNLALTIAVAQILFADPLRGCCRQTQTPEPCRHIPLEQIQTRQIIDAKERGIIDDLRANKTRTYQNQQPIIEEFTAEQQAQILKVYGGFGRNREVYETLLWDDKGVYNNQNGNETTTYPVPTKFVPRRKRRSTVAPGVSICPVNNIMTTLITAFDTDDELLQIVQFPGFNQWVLRQECVNLLSPHGQLSGGSSSTPVDISCQTIQRAVYLVAIRLDDNVTSADIDVQEVQVESCASFGP
ncbi:uncharacterized protein LOC121425547 [Lytechinus variegatus]|uniref:uncharacterized protein LOC121425547 n=1 Tax=Lytechinus variegatus TaxID=7654 RepID=UPI001BB19072|nr:uncharacterized protein LOC121425547 [Lytechinus variegatus]XP_041477561.1 uncharacterized protein LOC121425547 [Lytechinus variegatus]